MNRGTPPAAGRKPGAREAALDVLTRVDTDQAYSNLLLNQALTKLKLERQEAALATELVYGTIQRLNTIDYFLGRFASKGLERLQPWVRSLLRLSFYQIRYLDRIPPHAAVNEAVNLAKKRGHQGIAGLVNGILRSVLREKDRLTLPEKLPAAERLALEESHPQWLVERWIRRYGEDTAAAMCRANNRHPKASIRVNLLRGTREELARSLAEEGIETRPSELSPQGLILESGGNLAGHGRFASGEYTIQDESSMLVALAVAPEPGMRVLDCCAAPGGKTTHLSELMGNKGEIIASDVHEHKEKLIREQATRLKLGNIRTVVSDARELAAKYPEASFDRILLDAPCSGLGVIRRKPDLKWTKSEGDITEIAAVQRAILRAVHPLLKPGGLLIYSTCTTEPEENAAQIRRFLEETPGFTPEPFPEGMLPEGEVREEAKSGMLQLLPHQFDSDGFFIARLRKA
ncbi:16S rRNA (cytosine(967)-C(5))-methyltransferase RsmB [Gorillibacterium sp. sgz5001074]|uniref:16S rRNA (cytosine(967)-C(5))-methyltransferase RsmB n=1 Tax=Gorillibacterium sp. sgz5001074 TaxID=3446695 RepID=UPI003F66F24F